MRSTRREVLLLLLQTVGITGCGVHYYGPPPPLPPMEYHHRHHLSCGHSVRCHYYDGIHHYHPHQHHRSYWHQHAVGRGQYVRCYVEDGHHYLHHSRD